MTRKSKREIERAVDGLGDDVGDGPANMVVVTGDEEPPEDADMVYRIRWVDPEVTDP